MVAPLRNHIISSHPAHHQGGIPTRPRQAAAMRAPSGRTSEQLTRSDGEAGWSQPQPEQLNRLARLESTVQGWLPKAQALSVHEILLWCKGSAPAERLDEPALEAARRWISGRSAILLRR